MYLPAVDAKHHKLKEPLAQKQSKDDSSHGNTILLKKRGKYYEEIPTGRETGKG
jgi:hypothetical protein